MRGCIEGARLVRLEIVPSARDNRGVRGIYSLAIVGALVAWSLGCGDDTGAGDGGTSDSGPATDASMDADGGGDAGDAVVPDSSPTDARVDGADTGTVFDGATPVRCLPQAVGGEGGCDLLLGIQWNGVECVELSGCSCTGDDCAEIYATLSDCVTARRGCTGLCGPQSAAPVGDCDLTWGPYWDGVSCETFTGCDCAGDDCTRGYETKPECERLNRSCLGKCEAQMAAGVGACEAVIGVFWDGAECVTIGGCSCAGDDCGDAYESPELCTFAHRGCSP